MLLSNSQRVENYVNQFVQNGCPYFLLTNDKVKSLVIIDRNDGAKVEEDITDAAEKLRQTLTREYLNNDRSKLVLHCYENLPARGKRIAINSTADYTIFCTFYPELMENGYTPRQNMYGIPQRDEALNSKVERLTDAVAALNTKIELQDAEDENDIEEQAQPNIGNALLGMVSNNPQLQQLLINMFANFATNGMNKPAAQTVGLAGIENTELEAAINNLLSKGVTIEDLQKLASMDEGQINFLLGMLRK